MDVTSDAVRKWERGKRTPMFDAAIKIADVLGVSLDELAGRETPPKRKGGKS
jgi:transcriptional regulator with XRE-family HTH domain